MAMTRDEVMRIAHIARLALTEAEIPLFQEQLSAILDYAASLHSLDTSSIPPTTTVLQLLSALREDVPGVTLPQDEALFNAPQAHAGFFMTPPVIVKE